MARMRQRRRTGIWWGKLRGKKFVRQMHRWEDNIKMKLQEFRWGHGLVFSGSG